MRFCQPIGGLTGQKSGAVRSNSQDDDDQITALFFHPYICILTPLHPKKAGRGCVFSNLSCGRVSGWNLRLPARVWAAVWDLRVLRTRCTYTRPEFNAVTLQRTNVPLPAELNAVRWLWSQQGAARSRTGHYRSDPWRIHSTDDAQWSAAALPGAAGTFMFPSGWVAAQFVCLLWLKRRRRDVHNVQK